MDTNAVNCLIETIKSYPSLYSRSQSSSNNIDQKNTIWKDVSLKVNYPVEKCKAKWRNLRDSYQKAIKWRQELEELGKLENYHEYKHEKQLSFLEIGERKRKSSIYEDKRSKFSKKLKEETFEAVYTTTVEAQEYSPNHAVEYLVEAEQNEIGNEDDDYEHDELSFQCSSQEQPQEQEIHEIPDDQTINSHGLLREVHEEPKFFNELAQNDEITYQEAFANDAQTLDTQFDAWLAGVRQTLLSFPKLLRARAKKQINDLVSDFEITYLESLDAERRS